MMGFHTTPAIAKSTLSRLARELKGEPLFHSVRDLRIKICDPSSLDFLPFLVSPSLRSVHLEWSYVPSESESSRRSSQTDMNNTIEEFIIDLTIKSPHITTLIFDGFPELPVSWIQRLASLNGLRTLKLGRLVDARSFFELRSLLSFWALESLTLDVKHDHPGDYNSYSDSMHNLTALHLLQNLDITSALGLIREITAVTSPSPITNLAFKVIQHDASTLNSDNNCILPLWRTNWSRSLRSVSIIIEPRVQAGYELGQSLSFFMNVEKLHIQSSQNHIRIKSLTDAACFPNLCSLHLHSKAEVPLADLIGLCQYIPRLKYAALLLRLESPPFDIPNSVPSNHPLEELCVLKGVPVPDPYSESRMGLMATIPQITSKPFDPVILTDVASFLNRLFPHLESLNAEENNQAWDMIFNVVRCCQTLQLGGTKVCFF